MQLDLSNGDREMNIKKRIILGAFTALAAASAFTAPAMASGGKAMTWSTYEFGAASNTNVAQRNAWNSMVASNPNVAVVGCKNGGAGGCNAYQGDTAIPTKLRVLCIVPGSSAEPVGYANVFSGLAMTNTASSNWKFYYGWSGGQIGLTKPVSGSTITSRAVGDGMCKTALGDTNARMAEHHDNKVGGWALGGTVHPKSKAKALLLNGPVCTCDDDDDQDSGKTARRFWTAIDGQPANTW
jgi:hypothetical protein